MLRLFILARHHYIPYHIIFENFHVNKFINKLCVIVVFKLFYLLLLYMRLRNTVGYDMGL